MALGFSVGSIDANPNTLGLEQARQFGTLPEHAIHLQFVRGGGANRLGLLGIIEYLHAPWVRVPLLGLKNGDKLTYSN
jgi:hypothetical protein